MKRVLAKVVASKGVMIAWVIFFGKMSIIVGMKKVVL